MNKTQDNLPEEYITLKRLASRLDADRSSIRRWLDEAGVNPIAMGNGPRSAIRFKVSDIETWLNSRPKV